jgi:hypothetical protein
LPSALRPTGTTYRRCIFQSSSTTRTSRFSLSAFSSSSVRGSGITKAMLRPSGAQRRAVMPPFSSVSCSASPPSTRMRQMFAFGLSPGPRAEMNAIHFPSGDQAGAVADLSPAVSGRAPLPSARPTWMCESHSLFSPSVTAVAATKATRAPSGETRTSLTRLTFSASSGVHAGGSSAAAPRASRPPATRQRDRGARMGPPWSLETRV